MKSDPVLEDTAEALQVNGREEREKGETTCAKCGRWEK